jgi:hypothetical protein
MMFAAFLSSVLLVPELFSGLIPGEGRLWLVAGVAVAYLVIGMIITELFCGSKL